MPKEGDGTLLATVPLWMSLDSVEGISPCAQPLASEAYSITMPTLVPTTQPISSHSLVKQRDGTEQLRYDVIKDNEIFHWSPTGSSPSHTQLFCTSYCIPQPWSQLKRFFFSRLQRMHVVKLILAPHHAECSVCSCWRFVEFCILCLWFCVRVVKNEPKIQKMCVNNGEEL